MEKYLMYVRKSTEPLDRQRLSIKAQIRENRQRFAEIENVEVLEESHSAFKPNERPVFNEMIRRFQAGEAKGLIAWHPDRLSRNEIDGAQIIYLVRSGFIRDLRFANFTFENTPEGIMMLQMTFSQSQYSSAKLSFDVRRGNREKWEGGGLTIFPGQGYRQDTVKHTIEPDPERFALVRRAWDLLLHSGISPARIRTILNEDWGFRTIRRGQLGGTKLASSTIYQIFRNPVYAGFYISKYGQRYELSQTPMVTEDEFWRAQEILATRGRARPRGVISAYTANLIRCGECGCAVTVDRKRKTLKSGKCLSWEYYRCTKKKGPCGQRYLEVNEVERQLGEFLDSVKLPEEFYEWVKNNEQLLEPVVASQNKAITTTIKRTESEIDVELNNLLIMRRKDYLSDEQFLSQRAELVSERAKLGGQTSRQPRKWLEPLDEMRRFGYRCRFWLEFGTAEIKRSIVLAVAGSNLPLLDKRLCTQPVGPFVFTQRRLEYTAWQGAAKDLRTFFNENPDYVFPELPVPLSADEAA